MTIGQYTDLWHEIEIEQDGKPLLLSTISSARFMFGDIVKKFPSDNVKTVKDGLFKVHLTQEETRALKGTTAVQIQVKFTDGSVDNTDIKRVNIRESIAKEVL